MRYPALMVSIAAGPVIAAWVVDNLEDPYLGGNVLCGCIPAGLTEMRTKALGDPGLSTCRG